MDRGHYRRFRAALVRAALPILTACLALLPWRAVTGLGRFTGNRLWAWQREEREKTLANIRSALPELPDEEHVRIGRACFQTAAINFVENVHLVRRGRDRVESRIELEGWENVQTLREAGERILFVTGHCGNWEILSAASSLQGLTPYGIARELKDPAFQKLIGSLRRKLGGEQMVRGTPEAVQKLRRTLRGEGAMVLLIDQDTEKVDSAFVPFFGRPAYTPLGAAELASRHDFNVVPTFLERRDDGTHVCHFHPAMDLPEDPVEATAMMTREIEAEIRRRPGQWVWMHRRWRRQPGS